MLEIDSVTLNFSDKSILSGCYLNCKPGEIVGLLGRNGSGKSCLLKIIFGALQADFMHLRIGGKILKQGFKSGNVAYLPQESFLPPFLKIRQVLKGLTCQKDLILENEIIKNIIGLEVRELSGGELRMIECIWVLNHPASYILLDEPFSGISPVQIEFLQQLIIETGKAKGIILTDHIYRPLMQVSNRIVLLHNKSVYNIIDESDLIRYNYIPAYA